MRKLSIINKLIYVINYIFAILLLIGFVLPYISPKTAPSLSVLSLSVPVLIIVNLLFVIYWLVGLKKQTLLSLFCLGIGYFSSSPLYIFSNSATKATNEISIMNYNVRLFNAYHWFKKEHIPTQIAHFITKENPDIVCVQEYSPLSEITYPFQYIKTLKDKGKFGQAIYSKYKIINQGSLDFKHTSNNAIFVDVIKNRDTIRIYNVHFESLGLKVNKENLGQKSSEKLIERMGNEFIKQQNQVEQVVAHKNKCKYPVFISGDFNNTAYSWTYNHLITNMKDSFIEAGHGFGKTFQLKQIPLRIDFIFADKAFIFTEHKNYNLKYSDHEPIMAKIGI